VGRHAFGAFVQYSLPDTLYRRTIPTSRMAMQLRIHDRTFDVPPEWHQDTLRHVLRASQSCMYAVAAAEDTGCLPAVHHERLPCMPLNSGTRTSKGMAVEIALSGGGASFAARPQVDWPVGPSNASPRSFRVQRSGTCLVLMAMPTACSARTAVTEP